MVTPNQEKLEMGDNIDMIPEWMKEFREIDKSKWGFCRNLGNAGIILINIDTGRPLSILRIVKKNGEHTGYNIQYSNKEDTNNIWANHAIHNTFIINIISFVDNEYIKYGKITTKEEQKEIFFNFETRLCDYTSGLLKCILKCIKCKKNHANVLYMPCQHQELCSKCYDEKNNKCTQCNVNVTMMFIQDIK